MFCYFPAWFTDLDFGGDRWSNFGETYWGSWQRTKLVILHYTTPCHAILCYVMLCYVMLCYVMLCYVSALSIKWRPLESLFLLPMPNRKPLETTWSNFQQQRWFLTYVSLYSLRVFLNSSRITVCKRPLLFQFQWFFKQND